jgi:hypothetical protein
LIATAPEGLKSTVFMLQFRYLARKNDKTQGPSKLQVVKKKTPSGYSTVCWGVIAGLCAAEIDVHHELTSLIQGADTV